MVVERPPAEQKPYIHSYPQPPGCVCTSMWSAVNQLVSSRPPRGRTWRSTSTAKFPHCNTKKRHSHRLLRGIELTDNKENQSVGDWQRDKPQRPPVSSNITPGISLLSTPSCSSVQAPLYQPFHIKKTRALPVTSDFSYLSVKLVFLFGGLGNASLLPHIQQLEAECLNLHNHTYENKKKKMDYFVSEWLVILKHRSCTWFCCTAVFCWFFFNKKCVER